METRTRLLIVFAGLPTPEPNLDVHDVNGHWLARGDLVYPTYRIMIEYDGDVHRTNRSKWRGDIAVRDRLRALGWTVIVLTADDIYLRPLQTLWRVRDALVERGHPGIGSLAPRWRDHFAARVPGHLRDE